MSSMAASAPPPHGWLLWSISAAAVLAAHVAVAVVLTREAPALDSPDDTGAFAVELAPEPAAARDMPADAAAGPLRTAVAASNASEAQTTPQDRPPEDKPPEPEKPPLAEVPPPPAPVQPDPEVPLPTAAPPPPPQQTASAAVAPVEATSAPQVVAPTVAAVAKATSVGEPNERQRRAIAAWQNRLLDVIERNKRYPSRALAQRRHGTTMVAFRIDRKGQLLSADVVQSSGSEVLDAEALALMRRAQPFPVPPDALSDQNLSLAVPIRFVTR